ncbi:hypothetical protein APASM_5795 [Actinosynnema pretiosum subsp. pretiosum]|nr:hypothetical protein APASM_5795 [Actinosynnema pretiosum subsp. pretiosum]
MGPPPPQDQGQPQPVPPTPQQTPSGTLTFEPVPGHQGPPHPGGPPPYGGYDQGFRPPPPPPRGAPGGQARSHPATAPGLSAVPFQRRTAVVRIIGLVGIAVVSGLVWMMFQSGEGPKSSSGSPTPSSASQVPAGEFEFTPSTQAPAPRRDAECASHAYGQAKDFFTKTPCEELIRALYTTTAAAGGAKVHTSVAVVRMKSAADATALMELTNRDGTGNVNDLVKDGAVKVDGITTLGGGGYASTLSDRDVVIVESDTAKADNTGAGHIDLMRRISADALRLAAGLG